MNVNPGRLLILLEPGDKAAEVESAATAQGFSAVVCSSPEEILLQVQEGWPDTVLLPLGKREEESVLLSRALRKRASQQDRELAILLVVRGGTLVESTDEARDAGADHLIPNMAVSDLFARARRVLVGEGADDPDDDSIIVVAEGFEDTGEGTQEEEGGDGFVEAAPASLPEVRLKLDEVRFADYFVILGVPRDARTEAIASAVLTLRRQFDPGRAGDPRLKEVLSEIVDGVEDAWMVLGDSRLRRRYRQNLPPIS